MRIPFAKMQGAGNDFMVVRWPETRALPGTAQIRRWADRRRGVGFDSLLVVLPGEAAGADAHYRVFNADGGEPEQCGNGARCIARLLAGDAERELKLTSLGGAVRARIEAAGRVSIELVEPDFRPESLPFSAGQGENDPYRRSVAGTGVEFGIASLGNPHAVIEVDSVDSAAVGILGAALSIHPDFPHGVNVGFVQIESPESVRLRVYERGVGETLACGTGAAAAAAVGRHRGRLAETVAVHLPGGTLSVTWPGPGKALWQTGEATTVYEGEIEL